MDVSQRLKKIRGSKTLAELAAELKISPQNIHRYEGGRMPSGEFLTLLANKGININWILTGKGPMFSEEPGGETGPNNLRLVKAMQNALVVDLAVLLAEMPEEFLEALRAALAKTPPKPDKQNIALSIAWALLIFARKLEETGKIYEDQNSKKPEISGGGEIDP